MWEALYNFYLLPWTFLVFMFEFIVAGALWFALYEIVKHYWVEWDIHVYNPFKHLRKKEKDYGDKPEDYIL